MQLGTECWWFESTRSEHIDIFDRSSTEQSICNATLCLVYRKVGEPGLIRRFWEPKIVGSNPTFPTILKQESCLPGWHSGDCASFVMRNYQGFESLTRLHTILYKQVDKILELVCLVFCKSQWQSSLAICSGLLVRSQSEDEISIRLDEE